MSPREPPASPLQGRCHDSVEMHRSGARRCRSARTRVSRRAPSAHRPATGTSPIQSPQGTNTGARHHQAGRRQGQRPVQVAARRSCRSPARSIGSELKFNFTFPVDGQPLVITMTGKVDGDAIAGKADFGGFAERRLEREAVGDERPTAAPASPHDDRERRRPRPASTRRRRPCGGFGGKWDVLLKTPGGEFPANATLTDDGGQAVRARSEARWARVPGRPARSTARR